MFSNVISWLLYFHYESIISYLKHAMAYISLVSRMREYRDDDIALFASKYHDCLTCNNHSNTIIHVLDDLEALYT
jgi:hypothetical protein